MKHLFLSGRRIDEISALRALFAQSENQDALYYEFRRKFLEGSLERWLLQHSVEKLKEDDLPALCGYSPPREKAAIMKKLPECTDVNVRMKLQKLRTTTWFREDLFANGHDWYATATSCAELEELFDFIREIDTASNDDTVFDIFVCDVGEVYEITPRQLSRLHFVGFGMPCVRLICSYQETVNLQRLKLSFDGFKLECSSSGQLVVPDGALKNCEIAAALQIVKSGDSL